MPNNIYTQPKIKPENKKLISYSQISLYHQCQQKYKLKYVDKAIKDYNINLLFGSAMHKVIQNYLTVLFDDSKIAADYINLDTELYQAMKDEYIKVQLQTGIVIDLNKKVMAEYYAQGKVMLEWFRKHRLQYFNTATHRLLGCEIELLYPTINENVYFVGFVDLIIEEKESGDVTIYDIKTSRNGWKDYEKKDKLKISQVLLYKHFLSQIYNIDIRRIQVEYLIIKRELIQYKNMPYVQRHIQTYKPSQGSKSVKEAVSLMNTFIEDVFTPEGQFKDDKKWLAIAGDNSKNCRYCQFKNDDIRCPKKDRIFY